MSAGKLILFISSITACLSSGLFAQSYPQLKFQKFFGGRSVETVKVIKKSPDGALLIGGNVQLENEKEVCENIWVIKVDPDGKLIWERDFGGSGCERLQDMVVTPDSGVIFAGLTGSFIPHPEKGDEKFYADYFLGKIDKDGNISWLKSYGGLDLDQARAIARGADNTYLVAGLSNSQNFDVQTDLLSANMWAAKVDAEGNKIGAFALGGDKHDWANSLYTCRNGDFLMAGFTNSEDIDGTATRSNGDGWIVRMNLKGKILWQRIFSGKLEDYFSKVVEDPQGNILICGNFDSAVKGKQFWVLKLDQNGKKIFERIFGGKGNEFATSICSASDGGFVVTGHSRYYDRSLDVVKGGDDLWLIKFDHQGNLIWKKTFGGPDHERGVDVLEYSPGIFYVVGNKQNDFGQLDYQQDYWLLKVEDVRCDDMEIDVYFGLKNFEAYKGRSFKAKAIVDRGEKFLWDFGDGTTATHKEPTKIYDLPGVYEVKLTVFVNENCAVTYKVPNYIMVW